ACNCPCAFVCSPVRSRPTTTTEAEAAYQPETTTSSSVSGASGGSSSARRNVSWPTCCRQRSSALRLPDTHRNVAPVPSSLTVSTPSSSLEGRNQPPSRQRADTSATYCSASGLKLQLSTRSQTGYGRPLRCATTCRSA